MKFSNPKYRNEQLRKELENNKTLLAEYEKQYQDHLFDIIKYSHTWSYLAVKFAESKTELLKKEIKLLKKEIEKISNQLGEKLV